MTPPNPPRGDPPATLAPDAASGQTPEPDPLASPAVGPGRGAAATYLSDVSLGVRRSLTNAWMLTFTDLVALMLTFFVLLFAMSQVEQDKWQNMVRSLALKLDSLAESDNARAAMRYQKESTQTTPGRDLDYLGPVVAQIIAADPALAQSLIRRLPDRLVVSVPAGLLFDPETGALTPAARKTMSAIGGVLGNLDNVIDVGAHVAPSATAAPEAPWEASLVRAERVARMLVSTGYDGTVAARGYG
ncbi:MAG: flagellar motor protein MotB, partial [Kiloniellaceae bacterium]